VISSCFVFGCQKTTAVFLLNFHLILKYVMLTGGTKMLKIFHSFLMKQGDNLKAVE